MFLRSAILFLPSLFFQGSSSGRCWEEGTRADDTCKHRDWLPDGKKVYFKVFDFWDNFEYWDMHPEGDQKEPGKP